MAKRQPRTLIGILLVITVVIGLLYYLSRPKIDPRLVGTWSTTTEVVTWTLNLDSDATCKYSLYDYHWDYYWSVEKTKLGDELVLHSLPSGQPIWDQFEGRIHQWFFHGPDPSVFRRYRIISLDTNELKLQPVHSDTDPEPVYIFERKM